MSKIHFINNFIMVIKRCQIEESMHFSRRFLTTDFKTVKSFSLSKLLLAMTGQMFNNFYVSVEIRTCPKKCYFLVFKGQCYF
jgi:hypothetical protein